MFRFIPQDNVKWGRQECVRRTEQNQYYSISWFKVWCKMLPSDGIEIRTEPKGNAWIGIDNFSADPEKNAKQKSKVKRHIRHAHSYRGGGRYGRHGGYDITLIGITIKFIITVQINDSKTLYLLSYFYSMS